MGLSQRMGAINQIKNEEEPDPRKRAEACLCWFIGADSYCVGSDNLYHFLLDK